MPFYKFFLKVLFKLSLMTGLPLLFGLAMNAHHIPVKSMQFITGFVVIIAINIFLLPMMADALFGED